MAPCKPTGSDNPNVPPQQTDFAGAEPDNTGPDGGSRRTFRPSLRLAIDAKCKSCIYDPFGGGGTWREQVQACSSANCPLHPVRPISVKAQNRAVESLGGLIGVVTPQSASEPLHGAGLAANGQTVEERRAA